MNKLVVLLLISVVMVSCNNSIGSKRKVLNAGRETIVTFMVIRKDSSRLEKYQIERKNETNGDVSLHYASINDTFSIYLNIDEGKFRGNFANGDQLNLELTDTKYYTINGVTTKVLKLTGNKNVTDGSFSIYFCSDFGVLLSRSNTWRMAKCLIPDENSNTYLKLTTLLYRLQTDVDFITNPIPPINEKMVEPKIE